eukprot:6212866-Pleurochrysis_carterae.AAC.1
MQSSTKEPATVSNSQPSWDSSQISVRAWVDDVLAGIPTCAVLIDHPPPIRTPGFRDYFAGTRRRGISDAESTVDALRSLIVNDTNANRSVRRALEADLACAKPPSAPPSPPEAQPSAPSPSLVQPHAVAVTPHGTLFVLSALLNVAVVSLALLYGLGMSGDSGAFVARPHHFVTYVSSFYSVAPVYMTLLFAVCVLAVLLRPLYTTIPVLLRCGSRPPSQGRLDPDFLCDPTPFSLVLDCTLCSTASLFSQARLCSMVLTLFLASTYGYLALGARAESLAPLSECLVADLYDPRHPLVELCSQRHRGAILRAVRMHVVVYHGLEP